MEANRKFHLKRLDGNEQNALYARVSEKDRQAENHQNPEPIHTQIGAKQCKKPQ